MPQQKGHSELEAFAIAWDLSERCPRDYFPLQYPIVEWEESESLCCDEEVL